MSTKDKILFLHGVYPTASIDFVNEARKRINFLKSYLIKSKAKGLVLGISGGVDSTTAGRMCQIACEELRQEGYDTTFYAVRLPHGIQKDEEEAKLALDFISPDQTITVNIASATNDIHEQIKDLDVDQHKQDFHKGNVKARMRMLAQYEIAGLTGSLVVGTDHNAELVPAFYTKWGDQACDITCLNGLNKRQVRGLATALGAPNQLINKIPTADLEELRPQLADETALGFTYAELDDFLEGKQVSDEVVESIVKQYEATEHKRDWPVAYKST